MALEITAAQFLRELWGESAGWAELTTISKNGVKSFPFEAPKSVDAIIPASVTHNKTANVYMGVLLRKEKWPRPTGRTDSEGKPIMEFRGTEANAQTSWCVWAEFDFAEQGHKGKTIPEAEARAALKNFAFKPSIIVRSGGGIQVYWLLKEAAEGKDIWRVKAVNKALVQKFGADPQSVDLARILRIPWSYNLKYSPPRLVEISWWKPELRYTLDDFEDLLVVEPILPATAPVPEAVQQRSAPAAVLSEEEVAELAMALSNLWREGYRHESEQHVGGMFAWAGISEASAKAIIEAASNAVGGETSSRVKGVAGTYRRYVLGKGITGRRNFDEMAKSISFPAQQHAAYFIEAFEKIAAKIPSTREAEAPQPEEAPAPAITALPVSEYVKKVIVEGHPAYTEFRKNTETPAKFRQLKADGKLTRTEADCYVAVSLLQAGIADQSIWSIFRDHSNLISQKAYEREDKFDEYVSSIIRECQKAIKSQPKWQPTSIAHAASKQVDQIFEDEHFKVKRVLRYMQEPPTYDVCVVLDGIEYNLKCSLDQVWKFEFFSKAFFAKFNRHLPHQKDSTWERMYAAAEHETVQVEKEEGTFEGQMDIIISLLTETAVDAKSADISINHSAVRTKDGGVVFKTPIVLRMLKDRFSDAKKQDVIHYLKSAGWRPQSERLGKRVDWVWKHTENGNGFGHGPTQGGHGPAGHNPSNGHPPPPIHPKAPKPDLQEPPSSPEAESDMLFEMDLPTESVEGGPGSAGGVGP